MPRIELRSGTHDRWIYYWFVQYNPFFFFSALCVLVGMYMVTTELPDWYSGQLILASVMNVYELCLILGAVLLFRVAGKRRPGVILGLSAVFFLFDPTLRTEGLAALGPIGLMIIPVWIGLVVIKLAALRYAFHLRWSTEVWIAPVVTAVVLAAMPYLLTANVVEANTLLTGAAWAGALLFGISMFYRSEIHCGEDLDEWGETVLRRALRVTPILWAAFYAYHLITWMGIQEVPVTMNIVIPYLALTPLLLKRELTVWVSALGVLGLGLMDPNTVPNAALALASCLAWIGWRRNLPRLYLGVVIFAYLSAWTWGMSMLALPDANLTLSLLSSGAALLLGWRYQLYSAIPAAAVCLIPGAYTYLPQTSFQWGVTLLTLGFVKLFSGFAINWYANEPR